MQNIILNTGAKMPQIGLGTWKAAPGEVGEAVKYAVLEAGYRHIDCASIYGNEAEIGKAFKKIFSGDQVRREDVFITSKLWNDAHRAPVVRRALEQTLKDLRLDYLDLYLMHWGVATKPAPFGVGNFIFRPDRVPIAETWAAMEQLVKEGLVKAIGVSNFTAVLLNDLLAYANIMPTMNQIELHPYLTQEHLVEYCHSQNIAVTAYSPLGRPGMVGKDDLLLSLVERAEVINLAEKHNKTPAQILLRFGVERGLVCIPKSTRDERIKENIDGFDFSLSKDDMKILFDLNCNHRYVQPRSWRWLPYFD